MNGSSPLKQAEKRDQTVFVDINPLAEKYLTGIGRYTARLTLALAEETRGAVRFFSQDQEAIAPANLDWSQDQDLARFGRAVWRGRRQPLGAIPETSLAVHCCLRTNQRRFPFEVSVLHDFTPLIVPWTHAEKTVLQFREFFDRDLLASDAAIAVSKSTKADAAWLCGFDPNRVVVAPSGPSLCVERHLDETPATRSPNVGLVVSTLEPRKNAYFLLDWFRETEALDDGAELWWVGPLGWLTSRRKLRRYQGLKGRKIRFLGVVSDAALCRLYRRAGWSAYPSLYEGFGFPVLDALRHGTPVLSSYNSALCELDHPGVHYFDPYDRATLDHAFNAMRLSQAPLITAPELDSLYSWTEVARAILNLKRSIESETPQTAAAA